MTSPPAAAPPAASQPESSERTRTPIIIALDDGNTKDIWSTSVYSYAPGGGGPGGGLANDRLRVGGWGDIYVSLIAFDLPKAPCSAKTYLQLYNSADSPSPTPLQLEIVTAPWSWQDGDRLWWRNLPSTIPSGFGIIPAPAQNAWMSIDISPIFERWCNKSLPNYGVLLRPLLNNNNYDAFYSTRYDGDASLRPRIVVAN